MTKQRKQERLRTWLKSVLFKRPDDLAKVKATMSWATTVGLGYAPEEFRTEVIRVMESYGWVRRYAYVFPTSVAKVNLHQANAVLTAYWITDLTSAITETNPTFTEPATRDPTPAELERMRALLDAALQQGYAGFSTDAIPFHYLSNAPHTDKRGPTQYATLGELRSLLKVVREHDRVWQCTPDAADRIATFLRFFLTSGRLFGRPLKTSALTAVDLTHERRTWKLFPVIAGLLNSKLLDGRFHFQVLATPVRMYAEGMICPILRGVRIVAAAHGLRHRGGRCPARHYGHRSVRRAVRARVARLGCRVDIQP